MMPPWGMTSKWSSPPHLGLIGRQTGHKRTTPLHPLFFKRGEYIYFLGGWTSRVWNFTHSKTHQPVTLSYKMIMWPCWRRTEGEEEGEKKKGFFDGYAVLPRRRAGSNLAGSVSLKIKLFFFSSLYLCLFICIHKRQGFGISNTQEHQQQTTPIEESGIWLTIQKCWCELWNIISAYPLSQFLKMP